MIETLSQPETNYISGNSSCFCYSKGRGFSVLVSEFHKIASMLDCENICCETLGIKEGQWGFGVNSEDPFIKYDCPNIQPYLNIAAAFGAGCCMGCIGAYYLGAC